MLANHPDIPQEQHFGFEGPEKKLEIDFKLLISADNNLTISNYDNDKLYKQIATVFKNNLVSSIVSSNNKPSSSSHSNELTSLSLPSFNSSDNIEKLDNNFSSSSSLVSSSDDDESGSETSSHSEETTFSSSSAFVKSKAFNPSLGLRNATKEQWQDMLDEARCTIISQTSNEYFDSFVLSESSLFVFPTKLIVKTCGTTVLLNVIPKLLAIAKSFFLEVDFVFFSRKNFVFPTKQLYPHTSFDDEVAFLDKHFHGTGYIVGPLKGDHWYMYLADYGHLQHVHDGAGDQTLEILMHELDPIVMQQFFKSPDFISSKDVTIKAGIDQLIPGSTIDEFAFDPCGYSMNGLLAEVYSTIHITPESHCSFVSFETNYRPGRDDSGLTYNMIVNNVLKTFKPKRATVTLFADDAALHGNKTYGIFDSRMVDGFSLKNKSIYELEGNYNLTMCSFISENTSPRSPPSVVSPTCLNSNIKISQDISQESF